MKQFKLSESQKIIKDQGLKILQEHKIVFIMAEMRVGKTLASLAIASEGGYKKVLFITKKKAVSSIKKDFVLSGYKLDLTITNYEQVHKHGTEFDLFIIDESHSIGAFPRPALRTKRLKKIIKSTPLILLTGTPTPESYSQFYHQLWISDNSPFKEWKNFYKWVRAGFVITHERKFSGYTITDYSDAVYDKIYEYTKDITVTRTQEQAGIESNITDEIVYITSNDAVKRAIYFLLTDRYYAVRGYELVADTSVRLKQQIHQLCSGTIIDSEGNRRILDKSKARWIRDNFKHQKVAVFYLYIAERMALESVLDNIVTDPEEFNELTGACTFISQVRSGAEGISLREADVTIFYNIMFSSKDFQQARARQQDKRRTKENRVIWLFSDSKNSIEPNIYERVLNKQTYTATHFRNDYHVKDAGYTHG